MLVLDRVLHSAVHYPANYGFLPRTYCDDGDPLDVQVLGQEPVVPLCVLRARAIGVLTMRDEKGQDDKIIAVHVDDPEYAHYTDIAELPPHRIVHVNGDDLDRKSTRLNSSHLGISYAVFCLKKKKNKTNNR